nr:MAG TPA: hypothetical protein [Caudoviricetes sp.]
MIKTYIANTPLILADAEGKEFRVEAGEAVDLTPEQYELVAAHVTAGSISDADLAASGYRPEGTTPVPEQPPAKTEQPAQAETKQPAESAGQAEEQSKPRGSGKKD